MVWPLQHGDPARHGDFEEPGFHKVPVTDIDVAPVTPVGLLDFNLVTAGNALNGVLCHDEHLLLQFVLQFSFRITELQVPSQCGPLSENPGFRGLPGFD